MEPLAPAYLSALASQIGGLSAFLGGFAATFLATLLTLGHQGRLMTVTIGFAVTSAIAFILAVVAATTLIAILHPDAPRAIAGASAAMAQNFMTLGFGIGTMALLASLGCSGWTRSRQIGWITSIAAGVGALCILLLTVRIG
jgi:hypothetical protein